MEINWNCPWMYDLTNGKELGRVAAIRPHGDCYVVEVGGWTNKVIRPDNTHLFGEGYHLERRPLDLSDWVGRSVEELRALEGERANPAYGLAEIISVQPFAGCFIVEYTIPEQSKPGNCRCDGRGVDCDGVPHIRYRESAPAPDALDWSKVEELECVNDLDAEILGVAVLRKPLANGHTHAAISARYGSYLCDHRGINLNTGDVLIRRRAPKPPTRAWTADEVPLSASYRSATTPTAAGAVLAGTVKCLHSHGVSIHGYGLKTWQELHDHFQYSDNGGRDWKPCRTEVK